MSYCVDSRADKAIERAATAKKLEFIEQKIKKFNLAAMKKIAGKLILQQIQGGLLLK